MKTEKYQVNWIYADHKDTICVFLNKETEKENVGVAVCSDKDNFCRDTGRKVSLARAMRYAKLDKKERTEIWMTYRDMKNGGRW